MSTASPSIGAIRAQIQAIRNKAPHATVFGIFTPSRWSGPSVEGSGSDEIAIYQCDSPLQMRLALQEAPQGASAIVLVTPLDQAKVSDDILVRMAMRKLHPLNSWEIVRTLFKAKHLDPRITRYSLLADLLLEYAGMRDVPPVAGGLLDADTVWDILLKQYIGIPGSHPDVVELLRCTAESGLADHWKSCSVEFRRAAKEWISETAGDLAKAVLGCIESEHGSNALAIGLVMGVTNHNSAGHDLDKAAGRLEAYIGTTNLPTDLAKRWRDAALIAVGKLAREARRQCEEQAEIILQNIGAASHAWYSDELESGFEQRLSRFGQALIAHVNSRASVIPEELHDLYGSIRRHRLGQNGGRRMERVVMAIRLARWLADQNGIHTDKSTSLLAIAQGYGANSAYVDWARQVLRGGEPNKDLSSAYVRLVDRVTEIREAENFRFAKALGDQKAMGDLESGLIPVERLIECVTAKAAETVPVLLLVVDGMSWAVFRELAADITNHDWIELSIGPSSKRFIGLAALPSVTEVCRTSLLCGKLHRGQASDEVQGFTKHSDLLAASQNGFTPKLFHKAALGGEEDLGLAGDVRQALANKKQRVIGIVINAVDDHLDKGDQIDAIWNMQHIRVLEPILAEARGAGRLVILLSDHGHILDRHTEYREAEDGLRWRRPEGSLMKGEIEVQSSRTAMPEGGRVVVPWSEQLRYGPKKNGYHGGATPQEMLIPIGIFWPMLNIPEGFSELPAEFPLWWTEPTVPGSAAVAATTAKRAKRQAVGKQLKLFDQFSAPTAKTTADETWINTLFDSEVFIEQKSRLPSRVPLDGNKVQQLLMVLARRGGSMTTTALASAIEIPEQRLPGFLALMQRLFNVEGYAILDRQDAANTVVLNIPLLKKQFELGE